MVSQKNQEEMPKYYASIRMRNHLHAPMREWHSERIRIEQRIEAEYKKN